MNAPGKEVKVVLLGDSGVGKSSILMRFCSNDFKDTNDPTLGAAFMSKTINTQGQAIKFQIWDTAGQERYRALTPLYYRDAQIALIVYDISNRQSFDVLRNWVDELRQHGPKKLIQVLVGNKQDLIEREAVTYDEASTYARNIGATLKLTSCKENKGIQEMFSTIADQILQEEQNKSVTKTSQLGESTTVKVNTKPGSGKKGSTCC